MKWIGNRVSFIEQKNITTLVIYPEQTTWKSVLLYAWFSMWTTIGVFVAFEFFNDYTREEKLMLLVFFVFWLYFFVRIGRAVLWQAKGKELMKFNEIAFNYKRSIFGYGKANEYYYENIRKINMYEPKTNSFEEFFQDSYFVVGGERMVFEYKGKEIKLARKLNERDAKLLFQLITKEIERRLRKK
jgi:hypothetical protein